MSQAHGWSVRPLVRTSPLVSSSFLRLFSCSCRDPLELSESRSFFLLPTVPSLPRLLWSLGRFGRWQSIHPSRPRVPSIQTVPGYSRDNEKALSPHSEELVEFVLAHCASRHYLTRENLEITTAATIGSRVFRVSRSRDLACETLCK